MTHSRGSIILKTLLGAFVTVMMIAGASDASAFTPRAVNGCTEIRFPLPPSVIFHPTSMMAEYTQADIDAVMDVMADVHSRFNEIGGTSALIANVTTSPLPFVHKSWFGDIVPTIHVGFTSDASLGGAAGVAHDVDPNTCLIREAHMYVKVPSLFARGWVFTEPAAQGEEYFEAGLNTVSGPRYFPMSYMHELIHAFGLAHSNDALAQLNSDDRPWANGSSGHQIVALPDDVAGIRYLYPADSSRTEIGVLNSWWKLATGPEPTIPSGDAFKLCKPSKGSGWGVLGVDTMCGAGETSTEVCPGEVLRTRVAIANYGTRSLDVTMRLFFSEDTNWDGFKSVDKPATERREFTLAAARSSVQGRVYSVPSNLVAEREYSLLLYARGIESDTGDRTNDWIPLRGTVTTKGAMRCNSVQSSPLDRTDRGNRPQGQMSQPSG